MLGTTQNTSSYLDVCFSMVPFRGHFKLQPHPHWSPLGGLILVSRLVSPLRLYGSPPRVSVPSIVNLLSIVWCRRKRRFDHYRHEPYLSLLTEAFMNTL